MSRGFTKRLPSVSEKLGWESIHSGGLPVFNLRLALPIQHSPSGPWTPPLTAHAGYERTSMNANFNYLCQKITIHLQEKNGKKEDACT